MPKINNPGAEVITDSLRIREDNGKMGLVVGGQTVIPTEYEEDVYKRQTWN